MTSVDLCERLLAETGVAVLPGSESGCPAAELAFRLAYVDFDGEECLAAAEKVPGETELGWISSRTLRQRSRRSRPALRLAQEPALALRQKPDSYRETAVEHGNGI